MKLRWYQEESVKSAYSYLMNEPTKNPVICIPTGGGKSLIIAELCRIAVEQYQGRVIVLAHRKELISQNADKIRKLVSIPVGEYSAGLRRFATEDDIVCCGIQSVYDKAHLFDRRNLVLIDEVHLVPSDGEGMYLKFLSDMRQINPRFRLVGLTATPYRTGEGSICGPDRMFQDVCYSAPIRQLMEEGFLSRVTNKPPKTFFDTSKLHMRYGEFITREVESLFGGAATVEAVKEIVEKTHDRKSIMVFCSSVSHANTVAEVLTALTDDDVAIVDGETPPLERTSAIERFSKRQLRWMVNVDVLTTGFDAPCVDAIAILRATASPGLFAQIVGRGLRTYPDKQDCLILDFGGNVDRHGPIDAIDFGKNRVKRGGEKLEKDDPGKECPACSMINPSRKAVCECGFRMTVREPNHEEKPDVNSQIISEPEHFEVIAVRAGLHQKPGKLPTLRMDYKVRRDADDELGRIISEWVCIEHEGFARKKAFEWWIRHSAHPFPKTVEEACEICESGGVAIPKSITAMQDGKYWRVMSTEVEEIPPIDFRTVYTEEELPF